MMTHTQEQIESRPRVRESIHRLNSQLRGEISAAQTYKMAMDKIGGDRRYHRELAQLEVIQRDHGQAAQRLRGHIRSLGGRAADDAGPWGAWARTLQGAANFFGDRSALRALKEGEESGLKGYEKCLEEGECEASVREAFRELADETLAHIRVLNGLIESARW